MKIRILNLDDHKSLFKDEESFKKLLGIINDKVQNDYLVVLVSNNLAWATLKGTDNS